MAQNVSVVREDGFVKIITGNAAALHYPSALLPALVEASAEQFDDYRVSGYRIHWDQIGFSLLFAEASVAGIRPAFE
ncbi:hypothetical protein [Crenobacter intestini]|uniref:DUF2442 domain-containing protein n=1 Tax=Crenobacter intestini TaxID=2563443 RepID=A0A4T0UMR4_9NEIS|nr:hypothetical protein [Crenobacter intestini]TIC79565.1 hypothetical protein E5K04_13575 [Crenobacter intestini]